MLKVTCDLCGREVKNHNEAVTLTWLVLGVSAFPHSERHFHTRCAQQMKDHLDRFLKIDEEADKC